MQAINWESTDTEKDQKPDYHRITCFGRAEDGRTVCMHVRFPPYFYVSIPANFRSTDVNYVKSATRNGGKSRLEVIPDLLKAEIVQLVPFLGFRDMRKEKFLKLTFKTKKRMMQFASIVRGTSSYYSRTEMLSDLGGRLSRDVSIWESNIDPVLRFIHVTGLEATGWFDIPLDKVMAFEKSHRCRETLCDVELMSNDWKTCGIPRPEITQASPLVIASYDIETYSETGGFPSASRRGDVVFQIATSFQRLGEMEPFLKSIICLRETDPVQGVELEWYLTEQEVLNAWGKLMRRQLPDIVTGWNITGFDSKYMFDRAELLNMNKTRSLFFKVGKYTDRPIEQLRDQKLASAAFGQNSFQFMDFPGMFTLDLLASTRRDFKLSSYKLDAVAKMFLNETKHDVPYKDVFAAFNQTSADRRRVAEYCVQDTLLPLKLISKLCTLTNMMEMAKATWVPLPWLVMRGMQIRCFSLIAKEANARGFLLPVLENNRKKDTEKFTGATVLSAKIGAYFEAITALDFASLYPSIMQADNLCHSTLVLDSRYDNLPDIKYMTVAWESKGQPYSYRFAVNRRGLLPDILATLAKSRKKAKAEMKAAHEAEDTFAEMVFNGKPLYTAPTSKLHASLVSILFTMLDAGKQLAVKVVMNSLYGFCGAAQGMLPCRPVAMCVTTIGRNMIASTQELVEKEFAGSEVIYGKSA